MPCVPASKLAARIDVASLNEETLGSFSYIILKRTPGASRFEGKIITKEGERFRSLGKFRTEGNGSTKLK